MMIIRKYSGGVLNFYDAYFDINRSTKVCNQHLIAN